MLPNPCLMLVTDRRRCAGRPLVDIVRRAVIAGVDAVQLREKDLEAIELYDLACALRAITAGRCLFLVNDRLDIALAVGADGVHLPECGLPAEAARALAGPEVLIGRSVHSAEGARTSARAGADYVQLGTIFATASKPGKQPEGIGLVRSACDGLRIPCLAVGGISAANSACVIEAGAGGVAVVSAISEADDVEAAVRELRQSLQAAAPARRGEAWSP